MDPAPSRRPFLERLSTLLIRAPEDREQLLQLLHGAADRNLVDADALGIIEGALSVSETPVGQIMVPRAQMEVLALQQPVAEIVTAVAAATHSRYPVTGADKDDIVGILLVKDLLRHYGDRHFDLRRILRPAVFIPESKRLNVLLREFRASRNHMAIVVDEYGGVAGLVTIEDVLEQIVGDIEDEYDFDETVGNIVLDNAGRYRVKAITGLADFNQTFGTEFSDRDCATVGGLIISRLGRLPKANEIVVVDALRFRILRADGRRIHTVLVDRQPEPPLEVDR